MASRHVHRTTRRNALVALGGGILAAAAVPALAAAPSATDPDAFIAGLGERTFAALGRPGATPDRRFREVAGLFDEAVDVDLVARLVLGRHWRSLDEGQRAEYLRLFRAYTRDGLARRFTAYADGGRLTLTGTRKAGDDDTLVGTRILLAGGKPPVSVDWRVRDAGGGRLVIVDVVAEGVSMLVTNRSQFDSIVNSRGIDGLLAQMRGWHEETPGSA